MAIYLIWKITYYNFVSHINDNEISRNFKIEELIRKNDELCKRVNDGVCKTINKNKFKQIKVADSDIENDILDNDVTSKQLTRRVTRAK